VGLAKQAIHTESRRDRAHAPRPSNALARTVEKHKPGMTPVNVKPLLPPRQSRGFSQLNRNSETQQMGGAELRLRSPSDHYLDRKTLSVVAPVLLERFHISATSYARIIFAFMQASAIANGISVRRFASMGSGFGGMIFSIVTGRMVDRYSFSPTFVLFGILPLIAAGMVWTLPTHSDV